MSLPPYAPLISVFHHNLLRMPLSICSNTSIVYLLKMYKKNIFFHISLLERIFLPTSLALYLLLSNGIYHSLLCGTVIFEHFLLPRLDYRFQLFVFLESVKGQKAAYGVIALGVMQRLNLKISWKTEKPEHAEQGLRAEWRPWQHFSLFNFSQALQPHMDNRFSVKQLL